MKKFVTVCSLCICLLGLVACGTPQKEDTLYLGVNAVITDIDTANQIITVKDGDEEELLGNACRIACAEIPVIYCAYDTGKVESISFGDLQVGDAILLNVQSAELQKVKSEENRMNQLVVEQIQLGTQRLNQH